MVLMCVYLSLQSIVPSGKFLIKVAALNGIDDTKVEKQYDKEREREGESGKRVVRY